MILAKKLKNSVTGNQILGETIVNIVLDEWSINLDDMGTPHLDR
jgi:hypothetical protein